MSAGRNTLDAGLYAFGQSDNQFFNVLFNDGSYSPGRPVAQTQRQRRGGVAAGHLSGHGVARTLGGS